MFKSLVQTDRGITRHAAWLDCDVLICPGQEEGLFALKFNGSPLLLVLLLVEQSICGQAWCHHTCSPFRDKVICLWLSWPCLLLACPFKMSYSILKVCFFLFLFFPFRVAVEHASVNITGNVYGLQVKTKGTCAIETQMVVYGSMSHHQTTEYS